MMSFYLTSALCLSLVFSSNVKASQPAAERKRNLMMGNGKMGKKKGKKKGKKEIATGGGGNAGTPSPTSPNPTTQSPVDNLFDRACDPACPCCDQGAWPDFVSAVGDFAIQPCNNDTCCYRRQDASSEIIFLHQYDNEKLELPPYNTAFFSMEYTGAYFGCSTTPGELCLLCGSSNFGNVPVILSDAEAAACAKSLNAGIGDTGNCFDGNSGNFQIMDTCS